MSYQNRSYTDRYHGLINQGSTCYLNSVLQVLFMTKDFREALKSPDAKSLDSHLNELFEDLKKNTTDTYKITEKLGITREFVQSDAAECLENILSNVSTPEASQLFQGRLTQKNKCCKCKAETNTDDPFWNLPLELVDNCGDYSVLNGITKYFSESEVSGLDQLYCDSCEAKTDSTIKCEIRHHPDVLTLLLKRFKFDYSYRDYMKIQRSVAIPYLLEIPADEPKSQTYELYAIVNHHGNLRNGHYTVTIKSQDDEKWYDFNDRWVTLRSYEPFQLDFTETSSSAYLLFYKKISAEEASAENSTDVSASEASELGVSDKSEKHEHEHEEDTQKGKDVETAAVNHNSVDTQETEEKRRRDVRRDQEERPTTQPKLWTKADLYYNQELVDVGKSRSKRETSTFTHEQKLESSSPTPRKHEQEREEDGDVRNKQMKTDNEHSQRRHVDVANDGGDNDDAVQPSGRLDTYRTNTNTFKDQTSGKMPEYLTVVEPQYIRTTYQIKYCGGEQRTGVDHQKTEQNFEHETKKDELNGGQSDRYRAKRVMPQTNDRLNDPESRQHHKQNDSDTVTSQVKQVGGMAGCAQKTGDVASLTCYFQGMNLKDTSESQKLGIKDRNGKTENITGGQGITGSNPGNTVSPLAQVQDEEPSDRRGGVYSFFSCGSRHKKY